MIYQIGFKLVEKFVHGNYVFKQELKNLVKLRVLNNKRLFDMFDYKEDFL